MTTCPVIEQFTAEMHHKAVSLDALRRQWEDLTDDERRSAFDLFCDIEDCYPQSWQANANFYMYLHHNQPMRWSRHTAKAAA